MTVDRPDHPFDLARYVAAQSPIYDQALAEIRAGDKRSHWMWFIFPQIAGLGSSPTSVKYATRSLDEATAYLAHPVLGPRLIECAEAALTVEGKTAREIFGGTDEIKLKSCATLFAMTPAAPPVFERVLQKYFGGQHDETTERLLAR